MVMHGSPVAPKPVVLVTTSTVQRSRGLLRQDTLTGRNYAQALVAAGALPMLAPTTEPDLAPLYATTADALLLSGGCDIDPLRFGSEPDPHLGEVDGERDAFEIAMYKAFRLAGKPVLGICRGIQLINTAEGGSLHQHVPSVRGAIQHEQAELSGRPHHRVTLEAGSMLAAAFGSQTISANSYHHQAVDRIGDGLRAVGRSADGLIEALEGESGAFLLGVQWHPEMSWKAFPEHHTPFRLLVEAIAQPSTTSAPAVGSTRLTSATASRPG